MDIEPKVDTAKDTTTLAKDTGIIAEEKGS